jgi:hypothetical protein
VTLTASWLIDEGNGPHLWMAADSRISDGNGVLIDEGVKLFELPVVCRAFRSNPGNLLDQRVYYATSVGLLCRGSTLLFQNTYSTLVPSLESLIGDGDSAPTVEAIAATVGRVATLYYRSLGINRPQSSMTGLTVGGIDPNSHKPVAYELELEPEVDGRLAFVPRELQLAGDLVFFSGAAGAVASASKRLAAIRDNPALNATYGRAALNVIRDIVNDDEHPTVGGDVQIGFTDGVRFRRVFTATASDDGTLQGQRRLNNIDLEEVGKVGPCFIGVEGMVSP